MSATLAIRNPADHGVTDDWLCYGRRCWRTPGVVLGASIFQRSLGAILPARIVTQRWVRYRIRLESLDVPPSDLRLTPVTDAAIERLRRHPDRDQDQLVSGFRFWEHGLRRAYLWWEPEGPLCIQWLLTESDNAKLRSLPDWAGMYPPLASGHGQVENLFVFSTARRRGVAGSFEYALYVEAKRLGLRELRTHIAEANTLAHRWAGKTGWEPYGVITRHQFDCPGFRHHSLYFHRLSAVGGARDAVRIVGGDSLARPALADTPA